MVIFLVMTEFAWTAITAFEPYAMQRIIKR